MVKKMSKGSPMAQALRALPDPAPPEGLWDDIARRLEPNQNQNKVEPVSRPEMRRARRWVHAWVLPGAVVAVVTLGIWMVVPRGPERPAEFLDPVIAELLLESRSLEALVNSRPRGRNAIRDVLLIRIAEVDAKLNDAWLADAGKHAMEPLLGRRVALLHSLVDLEQRPAIRYTPALRPAVLSGDSR